jgi:tol-pal system protein YbgF
MVALVCSACARSAEERQLDEMRNEIERVQVERDDADREAMQDGVATSSPAPAKGARAAAPHPGGAPPSPGRATPIDPDSSGDSPGTAIPSDEDTEDPTPRPTFRITGSPRNGRGGWGGEDETSAAVTSTLDPEAKHAYDAALALVTAKQCDKALGAFAAFLVKWPDHPYADNAMFWRGECYFQAADYAHATEQFEGVLARFPAGNKAPDALLKLGFAQEKLGNAAKARESFDKLLHLYPQSEAARRIPAATLAALTGGGTAPRSPAPPEERR